jgi:hypothetical protein
MPEPAETHGHQRSPTDSANTLRPGHVQVDPCVKRPSKQQFTAELAQRMMLYSQIMGFVTLGQQAQKRFKGFVIPGQQAQKPFKGFVIPGQQAQKPFRPFVTLGRS